MPKEKKTIQVQYIKDFANEKLANPNYTIEEKMGIITMIERILLETNNYMGYMFLSLPDGNAPEIYTNDWVSRKYF